MPQLGANMITGRVLFLVLILLFAWFSLLSWKLWRLLRVGSTQGERKTRGYVTLVGLGCSAIAVGALLALHVSWISVEVSQHLGVTAIRILSFLLFWPTLAGLALCLAGMGRARWFGVATCVVTGLWWLFLSTGQQPPWDRHP
jgi:hypothetical protein